MHTMRKPIAAIVVMVSTLFLAACQSSHESTTQAADTENPQGDTPKTEKQEVRMRSVAIPAGTSIDVRLVDGLSSASSRSGDSFLATLDEPILVNGWVAVPKGSKVTGRVVAAQASGHLQTPAELSIT